MKYLSGMYALNLECSLDTCGDWHITTLNWNYDFFKMQLLESDDSILVDYGIEKDIEIMNIDTIKQHRIFNVANHIRALLDLLIQGDYSLAKGMKSEYICNDKYDIEIFEKVYGLKELSNWKEIDAFIGEEYRFKWLEFRKAHNIKNFPSIDPRTLHNLDYTITILENIGDYNLMAEFFYYNDVELIEYIATITTNKQLIIDYYKLFDTFNNGR